MAIIERKYFTELSSHKESVPSVELEINEHAKWVNKHIYSKPCDYFTVEAGEARREAESDQIPRIIHGEQHVTRAAVYVKILYQFYQAYSLPLATLTPRQLKLVQIAALLHDSGREGEGEDLWDSDSGINAHNYLISSGATHAEAKWVAELIANKDYINKNGSPRLDGYYRLEEDICKEGFVTFSRGDIDSNEITTAGRMLLHDVDCLEIKRARPSFDALYLETYRFLRNLYQSEYRDNMIFKFFVCIIYEVGGLINLQGDGYYSLRDMQKKIACTSQDDLYKYTLEQFATAKVPDTSYNYFPFIAGLLGSVTIIENIEAMNICLRYNYVLHDECSLFFRGVYNLSLMDPREKFINTPSSQLDFRARESAGQLELRKMRRDGVKKGNHNRSISKALVGTGLLARVGFLLAINPALAKCYGIYNGDIHSGYGKNRRLGQKTLGREGVLKGMLVLKNSMQDGGVPTYSELLAHNEIKMTLTADMIRGVFFTRDITTRHNWYNNIYHADENLVILDALYLYYLVNPEKGGMTKVYEYYIFQGQIVAHEFTADEIVNLWRKVANNYLAARKWFVNIKNIDEFKKSIQYKEYLDCHCNLDSSYPLELQQRINLMLQEEINLHNSKIIKEIFLAPVTEKKINDISEYLFTLNFITLSDGQVKKILSYKDTYLNMLFVHNFPLFKTVMNNILEKVFNYEKLFANVIKVMCNKDKMIFNTAAELLYEFYSLVSSKQDGSITRLIVCYKSNLKSEYYWHFMLKMYQQTEAGLIDNVVLDNLPSPVHGCFQPEHFDEYIDLCLSYKRDKGMLDKILPYSYMLYLIEMDVTRGCELLKELFISNESFVKNLLSSNTGIADMMSGNWTKYYSTFIELQQYPELLHYIRSDSINVGCFREDVMENNNYYFVKLIKHDKGFSTQQYLELCRAFYHKPLYLEKILQDKAINLLADVCPQQYYELCKELRGYSADILSKVLNKKALETLAIYSPEKYTLLTEEFSGRDYFIGARLIEKEKIEREERRKIQELKVNRFNFSPLWCRNQEYCDALFMVEPLQERVGRERSPFFVY